MAFGQRNMGALPAKLKNGLGGIGPLLLAMCVAVAPSTGNSAQERRHISFSVSEATAMGIDVSPDGQSLALTILGDVYLLPVDGGVAEPVLVSRWWDDWVRFSPGGDRLLMSSDRNGLENSLWTLGLEDRKLRLVAPGPVTQGVWDTHGDHVVGATPRLGLTRVGIEGNDPPQPLPDTEYAWTPAIGRVSGDIYYTVGGDIFRLRRETGLIAPEPIRRADGIDLLPRPSPDETVLTYISCDKRGAQLRLIGLATEADKLLHEFPPFPCASNKRTDDGLPLPAYAFSPDGRSVFIASGGGILRIDTETGASREVPFTVHVEKTLSVPAKPVIGAHDSPKVRHLRWTSVAPDGDHIVFSALGKVWVYDRRSLHVRRLTDSHEREYAPMVSPDGARVAYVAWSDSDLGALKVVPLAGGKSTRITKEPGFYANPAWLSDGSGVVYLQGVQERVADEMLVTGSLSLVHPPQRMALRKTDLESRETKQIAVLATPSLAVSRFFSPLTVLGSDGRVYFMEPYEGDRRQLASMPVTGGERRSHVIFDKRVDYAVPSSDGRRIAIATRLGLWVAELDAGLSALDRLDLSELSAKALKVSGIGPSNAHWADDEILYFGFLNEVYEWRRGDDGASKADTIDLQIDRVEPPGSIAFTGATVITMRGDEVIRDATVLVSGSRIAKVGKASEIAVPRDTTLVDAAGFTIMPGLIDVHQHSHLFNSGPLEFFPEVNWVYLANLAFGVTTIFDPAANTGSVFALSEMVAFGQMIGPRVYSAGGVVMGLQLHRDFVDIDGPSAARGIVGRLASAGAVLVKSYLQPSREARRLILAQAREAGIGVTFEGGYNLVDDLRAAADGHTAIEHAPAAHPFRSDVVQFLAGSRVNLTPGSLSFSAYIQGAPLRLIVRDYRSDVRIRRFHPDKIAALSFRDLAGYDPDTDAIYQQSVNNIAALIRAGARVSSGSHSRGGLTTHGETWLLVDGGVTPMEALRSATYRGAEKLGLDNDLGSLAAGKLADMVVLTCNPLDNIRCTADIAYVVKAGTVYHAESMTRLYPDYKPLPKPMWHSDEDWAALKPQLPEPLSPKE